jgi:spermidine synthase
MESNKHILGFSFALLLHHLNQSSPQHNDLIASVHRSAVLGAGGCSLPILLSLLYPQSTIDAIENNPSIVKVAKEYFGIADLGLEDRVLLHESCAMSWVNQKSSEMRSPNHSSYDLLFLDIYESPSQSELILDCEAPAEITLTNQNISHYLNLLSDSGVMAINVLGNDLGTAVALHRIKEGVIEYLTSIPASSSEDHASMQFAVGIMNLPFQSKESTLPTEEQCEHSLPRYNSVVFVVKNHNIWLKDLMESKDKIVEKLEEAMNRLDDLQQLRGDKIRYPFLREDGEEKRIVRDWLKTVKFVGIQR